MTGGIGHGKLIGEIQCHHCYAGSARLKSRLMAGVQGQRADPLVLITQLYEPIDEVQPSLGHGGGQSDATR